MNHLEERLRSLAVMTVSGVLLGSLATVAAPGLASAAGPSCPITVHESGSTTVYPALVQAQSGFQSASGCTLNLVASGSGAGMSDLLAGTTDIGATSTPLNPTQAASLYAWKVGGDAMVLAVRASANMSSVTSITSSQVKDIYNGNLTNWSALGGPNAPIVPRSRIIGSGSRTDLLRLFGVDDASEQTTIAATGLARFQTSQDEADAACTNDYQIVYTSLANLQLYGPSGQGCLKALTLDTVAPSVVTVQNGTYPAPRTLFLAMRKSSFAGSSPSDSGLTKAADLVNYMLSASGQAAVGAVGFVQVAIPSGKPIVDYDINTDGSIGLLDIGQITGKWGQSSTCKGWIRADVNNDGSIGLLDIGQITGKWGQTGFAHP